jgi:hypothetical protein
MLDGIGIVGSVTTRVREELRVQALNREVNGIGPVTNLEVRKPSRQRTGKEEYRKNHQQYEYEADDTFGPPRLS